MAQSLMQEGKWWNSRHRLTTRWGQRNFCPLPDNRLMERQTGRVELSVAPQLPLLPTVHWVHPFHLTWYDPPCQAAARSEARPGAQVRLFGRSPEDRACFFLNVLSMSRSGPESQELRISVAQP